MIPSPKLAENVLLPTPTMSTNVSSTRGTIQKFVLAVGSTIILQKIVKKLASSPPRLMEKTRGAS